MAARISRWPARQQPRAGARSADPGRLPPAAGEPDPLHPERSLRHDVARRPASVEPAERLPAERVREDGPVRGPGRRHRVEDEDAAVRLAPGLRRHAGNEGLLDAAEPAEGAWPTVQR